MRDRYRSKALIAMVGLATGTAGIFLAVPAQAATGCAATYTIQTQWQGGFTGGLSVTNLGDARSNWTISFTFPDSGQKVTQGWNATFTQSGSTVSAASMSYNGTLATNTAVTVGFNGSFTSANPAVSNVALNGVACTGSITGPSPSASSVITTKPPVTTAGPVSTTGPAPTGTPAQHPIVNPDWGRSLPPAGAVLSHDYSMLLTPQPKGYTPRTGECSNEIHARYWTYGPDGKVYPTWHPVKDAGGCSFGHEHGDDPRGSDLFSTVGFPPFSYAAEVMESDPARSDPSMQRHEDHVGHKVLSVNNVNVIQGDNGTSFFTPSGSTTAVCDVLLKFHQGTHSADAFTNNVHELIYDNRCTHNDNGQVSEARFTAMIPLGRPGGFSATDCPGPNLGGNYKAVGTAVPADSPSDTRSLGRLVTDESCVTAIQQGKTHLEVITNTNVPFDTNDLHEFWFSNFSVTGPGLNFNIQPLFYVLNPSRFYNSAAADQVGHQVDLCYPGSWGAGIRGDFCDTVRAQSGTVTYDDVRSPFKGTLREYRPGNFSVQNTGPTTVYTDVYGKNVSSTPFAGSIKQYFSGNHAATTTYVRGATRDYATSTVHSPN